MASSETIADLRSRIDAVLQGSTAQSKASRPLESKAFGNAKIRPAKGSGANSTGFDGSSSDDAFRKIVALVNASDKSERAIRDRLERSGFSQDAIESAIVRAKEIRYIDDIRYGEVLVRSRFSQGKGSAGIERELLENDIDPYDIPGYPEEFGINPDSEYERALALLERKPPHAKNAREAAYRKLVQKGYSSSVASTAARRWVDMCDERFGND